MTSGRSSTAIILTAAFVAAMVFLTWHLKWAIGITFTAALVGVFLYTGGKLLTKVVGGNGTRGLALFCLILVALVAGFAAIALPSLISEGDELVDRGPQILEQSRQWLGQRTWGQWAIGQFGLERSPAEALSGDATRQAITGQAMSTMGLGSSVLIYGVFLAFTGLYLAIDPALYRRGVLWLLPKQHRESADDALIEVGETLERWLYARLLSMAVVGVASGLGLWALGVPLPFICAVIAFVLCFVPNFGPILSVLPPILLALTATSDDATFVAAGVPLAGAVAVLYLLIQVLESYVLTPIIQQKAVDLPPALLIVAQLVMGLLLGIIGVIIAAPLVAAIMTASKELWIEGDVDNEDPKETA